MKRNILKIRKINLDDKTYEIKISNTTINSYYKKPEGIEDNEIIIVNDKVVTIANSDKLIPISNPYPYIYNDSKAVPKDDSITVEKLENTVEIDSY